MSTTILKLHNLLLKQLALVRRGGEAAKLSHDQLLKLYEALGETRAVVWPVLRERMKAHAASRHPKGTK